MMNPTERPRRVLFVAYTFPPVGGAGVQRVVKFIKYLPSAGWYPSVLTPSNPSVPVLDSSLETDVPAGTIVRRARTLEPSYALKNVVSAGAREQGTRRGAALRLVKGAARRVLLSILQPDPQILWYRGAVAEGRRLSADLAHDAVLATGPPFSSFVIGAALAARAGVPLVLDYRDEWGLSNRFLENRGYGWLAQRCQSTMQRALVRRAHALIATTQSSADALTLVRDRAGSRARVVCIYNGFDPDDFSGRPASAGPRDRFRMVYAGTLWNLTSARPLVDALRVLSDRHPELAGRLELVMAGRKSGDQHMVLSELSGTPLRLIQRDYIDHGEVLRLMTSADALCALLTDAPGAERVLPGKIFEYMASRRRILAIAPRGDLWDVLAEYPAGHRFHPSDIQGIAQWFHDRLESFRAGDFEPSVTWNDPRFDRRQQAVELARVLEEAVESVKLSH